MTPSTHPAPRLRDQNSHILSGQRATWECREWLVNQGFTVLRVEIGEHALPVVRIQLCARCSLLKDRCNAANYKHECNDSGVRESHWKAEMLGCRVEWIERGH